MSMEVNKMNSRKLGIMAFLAVLIVGVVCVKAPEEEAPVIPEPEVPTPPEEQPIERPTEEQNDANSGGDVSAELVSPYPVDYGVWRGTLTEGDDGDAYGIRWNPGDTIDIVIIPARGLDIIFEGQAGEAWIEPRNDGVKGEPESVQMTTDIADNIKRADILISAVSGSGDYTLKITATPQNDGGSGKDAPWDETKIQPPVVSAGKYEGCYLGSMDWWDAYAIRLNEGQKALIKAIPSAGLDIELDGINDNFRGEPEELTIEAYETRYYFFYVGLVGETKGTYTLEISVQ